MKLPLLFAAFVAAFSAFGLQTDGLVVLRNGKVVREWYHTEAGYSASTPHIAWSATKSVVSALVGIAVGEGRVHLSDPVVPGITVKHLLEMGSCLQWREEYEDSDPRFSSVIAMLYGPGRWDMARFVAAKPRDCDPGSRHAYSSGDTNLLTSFLGKAYADDPEFPWTKLFVPLGMTSAVWEQDTAGTFVGSSYLYATPRDLARFGELFLKDGWWGGRRLLPEGWVAYSSRPVPGYLNPQSKEGPLRKSRVGGPSWWTNGSVVENDFVRPWPSLPPDAFLASGHWGQLIIVIPSLKAVIARTGNDRDGAFDIDTLAREVMPALRLAE